MQTVDTFAWFSKEDFKIIFNDCFFNNAKEEEEITKKRTIRG